MCHYLTLPFSQSYPSLTPFPHLASWKKELTCSMDTCQEQRLSHYKQRVQEDTDTNWLRINDGSGDLRDNQTTRMATLREKKRKTRKQNMIDVKPWSRWKKQWTAFPKETFNLGFQKSHGCNRFPHPPTVCLHVLWNSLWGERLGAHLLRIRIGLPSNGQRHCLEWGNGSLSLDTLRAAKISSDVMLGGTCHYSPGNFSLELGDMAYN